jgi:membrane protease YdiL (CAAX protease family)
MPMNFDENNPLPPEPPQPADPPPPSVEPLGSAQSENASRDGQEVRDSRRPALREDLCAPWDWIDLLIFVFVAVAGAFLVNVLLIIGFALFGVSLAQLRSSVTEMSFLAILSQALLFAVLLGYLAAHLRLRFDAPFWRTIGWRTLETGRMPRALAYLGFVVSGFLLSLLVQLASAVFPPKTKLPMQTLFQDRRTALLVMLLSVLLAPIVEETIFRGYIYPVIARSFGVAASVISTGTLFGLLHAPQLWGGWGQIVLLVMVGIVFTYVRAVTGTVVASYLLHLSYNFTLFLAFLVGSHWLRILPSGY